MRTSNVQRRTSNIEREETSEARSSADRLPVYDLEERLLKYAASVIRLAEKLPRSRAGNHVAGQMLRSGTSPLPNHGEAQAAESDADFLHKFSVCLKELRETLRCLKLIRLVPLLRDLTPVDALIDETDQLVRIFVSSIRTVKRNQPSGRR